MSRALSLALAFAMLLAAVCVIPQGAQAADTWATTPPTAAYVGGQYSYTPMLSDGSHKTDWAVSIWNIYPSDQSAGWLTWSGDTLQGTPNATVLGTTFTCNLTTDTPDGMGVMYHQWTITILSPFTSSPVTTGKDGVPYEYTVTTAVNVTSWALLDNPVVQPAGDSFNARSWRLVGNPQAGDAGSYPISIRAEIGGAWQWQNYTLVIAPDLAYAFSSTPVINATANITYQYQVISPYAVTSWNLTGPEWLSISPGGLISGTAPNGTDGSFNISVRATIGTAGSAWQNYTLEVERQPYTAEDGLAIAFGLLGFAMVLSALVSVMAVARRR